MNKTKINRRKAKQVAGQFSPIAAHLTIPQAAARHNVAPYFLRQAIIKGRLNAALAGRRYIISVEALNNFFGSLAQ